MLSEIEETCSVEIPFIHPTESQLRDVCKWQVCYVTTKQHKLIKCQELKTLVSLLNRKTKEGVNLFIAYEHLCHQLAVWSAKLLFER